MRELVSSLTGLQPTAPTWCSGWSAHDLTAHVAAAAEERANLIEEHLAGEPPRPTRSWEVREPPFRAMPAAALRQRLVHHALRFESAVAALSENDTIVYTGWPMTAERLRMHSHSEAVLHRWDLVGDDDISVRLLSDPAMVAHTLALFDAMPALAEARRWRRTELLARPLVLRSDGNPDVVVSPGEGLSVKPACGGVIVELRPPELPLFLWGRCPSRLRDCKASAESIDEVLERLCPRGARSNA